MMCFRSTAQTPVSDARAELDGRANASSRAMRSVFSFRLRVLWLCTSANIIRSKRAPLTLSFVFQMKNTVALPTGVFRIIISLSFENLNQIVQKQNEKMRGSLFFPQKLKGFILYISNKHGYFMSPSRSVECR